MNCAKMEVIENVQVLWVLLPFSMQMYISIIIVSEYLPYYFEIIAGITREPHNNGISNFIQD